MAIVPILKGGLLFILINNMPYFLHQMNKKCFYIFQFIHGSMFPLKMFNSILCGTVLGAFNEEVF